MTDGPDVTDVADAEDEAQAAELRAFWDVARIHAKLNLVPDYLGVNALESLRPSAWMFGGTPEQADALLALVLDGTKTATSSSAWEYDAEGEHLPEAGTMSIVTDSQGHPAALIAITEVVTVPFDEVTAEHAYAEGEGDRSLAHWRQVHEGFFREFNDHGREFTTDMPVVCETFRVLYQRG